MAGFAGSAVSQLISGQKFDSKKAWGAAANGAIVGGVKDALVGSGLGAGLAFATDFAAGTLGSAAEQKITTGKVDVGRSVVSGLTNAVSGKIYGNSAIKTLGKAVGKGAAAGAATSGINYIYDALTSSNSLSQYGGDGLRRNYSSVTTIDPRGNCRTSNKLGLMTTTTSTYGYQYSSPQTEQKSNFSFGGFVASVATGAALGGLSSALFYGAGKAVEAAKSGIASRTRNTQAVVVENESKPRFEYDLQFFGNKGKRPANLSPKGASRRGAFREAKRTSNIPVTENPSKVTIATDRRGNVMPERDYYFSSGKVIREHYSHTFPDNPSQNRGPHFNDIWGNHFDY